MPHGRIIDHLSSRSSRLRRACDPLLVGLASPNRRPRAGCGALGLTMALHHIERMVVEVDGEGDPLVLIHGLGGSTNTWTPLMPALARYRDRKSVV